MTNDKNQKIHGMMEQWQSLLMSNVKIQRPKHARNNEIAGL